MSNDKQGESSDSNPSKVDQIDEGQTNSHDAVFGEMTGDGPNYRNVRHPLLHAIGIFFIN